MIPIILNVKESVYDKIIYFLSHLKDGVEIVSYEEEQEIRKILENMTEDDKQVVDSRKYTIDL